jgi:hypothetical protein
MSHGARGHWPKALPPHPARVVQRKEPHPARVVQRKEPHPATLARSKPLVALPDTRARHPASEPQGRSFHPASRRDVAQEERTSVQRMNAPSRGPLAPRGEQLVKLSVGLLVMEFNNGKIGFGTGTLISPHHVLTCAHNCLSRDGARATKVHFYPGFMPPQFTSLEQLPKIGWVVELCVYFRGYEDEARSGDIAVFRLYEECYPARQSPPPSTTDVEDRVFPKVAPKGTLMNIARSAMPRLRLYGYQFDGEIVVTEVNNRLHLLVHKTSTADGSSGSPLFKGDVIWGVHTCLGNYTFGLGIFDDIREFVLRATELRRDSDSDPFLVGC